MSSSVFESTVAETLAERIVAVKPGMLPAKTTQKCEDLLIDVIGLCVTARKEDYVLSEDTAFDDGGISTVIGHRRTLSAAGAAFVNGTAAHGQDFDDTFEGGPVHAGAVVVPAVLAASERYNADGAMALLGIAVGTEVLCRLSLVVPKAVHRSGFHPTAVFGALGAAAGVSAALGMPAQEIVDALGIAGSMASGIIEYLADGSWTKRLHPGWAAQAGLRAALLARQGFKGPRSVLEGTHGLFSGFTHSAAGDYERLTRGFGKDWISESLAFKPFACGTMTHPYIDCAIRLAERGIAPEAIQSIICEVAEGTVHRLWEPLALKQAPPNAYAAKFSTPFCIAVAFITGDAGLAAFSDATVRDPRIRALAAKVSFVIDADNAYPANYTGHIRAVLNEGSVIEERQPHLRGGTHEKLSSATIEAKFFANAAHGGLSATQAAATRDLANRMFDGPIDLSILRC